MHFVYEEREKEGGKAGRQEGRQGNGNKIGKEEKLLKRVDGGRVLEGEGEVR